MFRRLADRVTSAVASVAGSSSGDGIEQPIERLASLGFSDTDARHALQISGGNAEQAAEWLLTNAGSQSHVMGMAATTAQTEDEEFQRAISASLEDSASANISSPTSSSTNTRSAASKRAGLAALSRMGMVKDKDKNNATSGATKKTPIQSHPNVKVPKRLIQHDKEDVILRCAQRVAPHAIAVDTLLKSLNQLQQNATDLKYRTIDTSTAGFKRSLNVPGAVDFLKAMGYHTSYSNKNILELSFIDPATLFLGISALEQIQLNSEEYAHSKSKIVFDKEIKHILALADQDMQEALKRSEFMSKLPSEPATGGGLITVELGLSSRIQRKFDGDDCLEDVLHWLGANGSVIPEKLERQQWYLVNRNHPDAMAYNVQDLKGKTLQYIGCWPSGRLAVVPLRPTTASDKQSSSRGLGAAPIEVLRI